MVHERKAAQGVRTRTRVLASILVFPNRGIRNLLVLGQFLNVLEAGLYVQKVRQRSFLIGYVAGNPRVALFDWGMGLGAL